jgi:dTDP-glucose 4,6-dehydratase
MLGWVPKYSLEDGLEETIKWVKDNLDNFKTDVYNI